MCLLKATSGAKWHMSHQRSLIVGRGVKTLSCVGRSTSSLSSLSEREGKWSEGERESGSF